MKKINSFYVNISFIFLLEIIFSLALFSNINLIFLFYTFLSSIIFGLFITLISNFSKKEKINKLINIILNSFITIVFIAQYTHFKFYQIIFSIYSMLHGGQVFEWFDQILKVIFDNWHFNLILLLPLILFLIFIKRINFERHRNKVYFIYLIVLLFSSGIFLLSLKIIDTTDTYSPYNLYYSIHSPTLTVKKMGLATTMRLDLKRMIFGFEEKVISVNKEETNFSNTIIYNKLDFDFDSLIANEEDTSIKEIHEYFQTIPATNKNNMTGYFEGKNLIYIMAESFNYNVIDEKLTPTLYKLYNEGITFSNFYTPIFYVSTSDGEYITINSLLPKEGVWSFTESKNNDLIYAMGNMFKKNNYATFAFHNGTYTFYDRNYTHPNAGFDTFIGCGNGLEAKINCDIWPQSDVEMIEATFDYYKNERQFLTYYMTISGHLNYTYNGNTMAAKNKDYVKNLSYSEPVKAYIATNIELDKALELLIKKLKDNNLLDDTVIIISADHYPYGLNANELNELGADIKEEKFDLHKNNLIIWNNNITKTKIDKYGSNLDILPTIYNAFGFAYDSRLLMGNDLFSNAEGLVLFSDRSFITKYGKYNSITEKFTKFNNNQIVATDYVTNINKIIYNKFAISRLILEKDYYKYLDEN